MTGWRVWLAGGVLAAGVACSGGAVQTAVTASTQSGAISRAPGVTQWSRQDGVGNDAVDVSSYVAFDAAGDLYRIHSLSFRGGTTNGEWYLDKLDAAGNALWTADVGPASTREVTGLTADRFGNVFVIGQYHGATEDGVVWRWPPDGRTVWGIQMAWRPEGVAADADGNVIVAAGPTLTKYSPTAAFVWARTFDHVNFTALAIDASGNLAAAGWVSGQASLDGHVVGQDGSSTPFFARFGPDGSNLWVESAPSSVKDLDSSGAGTLVALIDVGSSNVTWNGMAFAAGQTYLLTLNADGRTRWSQQTHNGARLAVDPGGQVSVATLTPGDCSQVAVEQRDLAGDFLWAKTFPAQTCDTSKYMPLGNESLGDIAVGPDHSIVVGGSFTGSVDFGDATRSTQQSGEDPDDAFLVSLANGETPTAYDDFQRTGSLGSGWTVAAGSWSTDGNFASGTGAGALAVSNASPALDSAASVRLNLPLEANTQAGVVLRANPNAPALDHYSAVINASGLVTLQRTFNSETLDLADGAAQPDGPHRLTFAAFGTDPVVLSVAVDGRELIHYEDSSADRITFAGQGGMYDSRGLGQPMDAFWFMPMDDAQGTTPPSRQQGPLVAVARFDGSTGQGTVPDTEDLDGTGSYSTDPNVWITKCHWDFGDGATQDDCWVEHIYNEAGTFHPTLTLTGSDGSSASTSLTVTVTDSYGGTGGSGGSSSGGTGGTGSTGSGSTGPVVAVVQFDGSTGQGSAPDTEDLDGTSSYSTDPNVWIAACHWDFGDGATAEDCWVEHVYKTAGTYHPTLTVTGSDGSTSSASVEVDVTN